MAEQCTKCGAELFTGQRFCRACGASTDELAQEQTPTQMMPPQPGDWGARSGANTAPTYRSDTNPVYAQPSGYQPSVPPMHPQVVPPYTPPASRSRLGWLLAALGVGLFAAIVFAVMMMARIGRRTFDGIRTQTPAAAVAQAGETQLTDASADQVTTDGSDVTLIKTFPLDDEARFSIKALNGSIEIQAWDRPEAEVRAIGRGDRSSPVFFSGGKSNLSLRAGPGRDVRFVVNLPRHIGRVTLDTKNGPIKITGVVGQIFVAGANGSIDLIDVSGVSKVQTANGKIRAILDEPSDGPMEFVAANGTIDITVKPDFNADLEATTVRGGINIDDSFGIQVQREFVASRARGQLGKGGERLSITTVNGSIRLSKQ